MSKFKTVPMINFCHNASSLIDLKNKLSGACNRNVKSKNLRWHNGLESNFWTYKEAHDVFETFGLISTIVYKIMNFTCKSIYMHNNVAVIGIMYLSWISLVSFLHIDKKYVLRFMTYFVFNFFKSSMFQYIIWYFVKHKKSIYLRIQTTCTTFK